MGDEAGREDVASLVWNPGLESRNLAMAALVSRGAVRRSWWHDNQRRCRAIEHICRYAAQNGALQATTSVGAHNECASCVRRGETRQVFGDRAN